MMDYLGAFVYTGNPNKTGLATWSPWTANTGGTSGATNLLTLNANTTSILPVSDPYGNAELLASNVSAQECALLGAAAILCTFLP